jgi:hypothetical protein
METQHYTAASNDLLDQGAACNITFARALKENLLQLVEPRQLEGETVLSRLVRDRLVGPAVDGFVDLSHAATLRLAMARTERPLMRW